MIDRATLAIEELRASVILFADFVIAGDFGRAEGWAAHAFEIAASLSDEDIADA